MAWYVAHTHAGAETKARVNIERQGFKTYLPQYLKSRRHARKTEWVRAPLFPRYIFIWLDAATQRWLSIQSTIGVRQLVCGNGKPLPVPDGIVEELRQSEDESGLIDIGAQQTFAPGEKINITAGPLLDRTGIFQCKSDMDRAVVLLNLLGRNLRVTVPQSFLCRA